ncbi:MAG: CpaD family pilus assembly protein [Henriciella sp.]|nr:CpaD family pilus assembly protein [Hyphomonadaceae bacterium]
MTQQKTLLASAVIGTLVLVAGCQSGGSKSHVPHEYYSGTVLDRHEIGVTQRTEYLEVQMDPRDTQLRLEELAKVRTFLDDYADVGHGPLVVSMPKHAENPQLAVGAVSEIRQLAWEAGISYEAMLGAAYDATNRAETPIVMAFKTYQAVPPECQSAAEIDFANAVSNNDLPTLGCAIRTNMAAMIAEPADLLGGRELSEGDRVRRGTQLQQWQRGETTAATRTEAESATVSTVVQ